MRTPLAKSSKKLSSRSSARGSVKSASKAKSTRLKPATKRSAAGKARALKATQAKPAKTQAKAAKTHAKAVKTKQRVTSHPAKSTKRAPAVSPKNASKTASRGSNQAKTKQLKGKAPVRPVVAPVRPIAPPPPPQLTRDEAAALKAFEAAHREFSRGHFGEARNRFRALVDKYPSVSEVTARSRTYLAVAESRLRTELALPRDADSLYDRGVIELNRGDYVAAQELFERALRQEPEAAHIHYGLAATRARLGAIDTALKSLERALDLQPNLRIRAQRDQDLNPLRSDPDFEQLVFASRE
jgi:tetratricopeptide (TPR) repeat protein